MIDFHTHMLPGLDDGAINVDESISIARSLASFGYTSVCCTPHCIKGYYDYNADNVREATLMLQADLDNVGIRLDLWPGMEYMLDECFMEFADDLLPLGKTKLVLCEAPPQAHPGFVQEGLELILKKGFVPLVAHPERTQFFYEKLVARGGQGAVHSSRDMPGKTDFNGGYIDHPLEQRGWFNRLFSFLGDRSSSKSANPRRQNLGVSESHNGSELPKDVLFQANLGSFSGYYGPQVQQCAYDLLKLGIYTAIASDIHDSKSANHILVQDKLSMNPLLKKLSAFDGSVPDPDLSSGGGKGEQIGLF